MFFLIAIFFVACRQNNIIDKNVNKIDSIQLTLQTDTLQQNSDTIHWRLPNEFTPISFLNFFIKQEVKDTLINVKTMVNEFPKDWIKQSDIDTLITLITSTKKCNCFLNPLSSYVPTNEDADIGGYAIIFINSFRQKNKINLGLYSCPKTDKKSVEELNAWWIKYNQTR